MKQYLLDYFTYNDWANRKILQSILQLPEKDKALYLFSHLIYAQEKWYNRVTKELPDSEMPRFGPAINDNEIEQRWDESVGKWQILLNNPQTELEEYVVFQRPDSALMRAKLKDIIFQLNCHSVYHRAQIASIISSQGLQPPQTDYIVTVMSEIQQA